MAQILEFVIQVHFSLTKLQGLDLGYNCVHIRIVIFLGELQLLIRPIFHLPFLT